MENELIYIEDFTVVKDQTIFHRNKEDEWKYVGTWGDLLEEKNKQIIQLHFPAISISSLFIAFGHYSTAVDILQENLVRRNKHIQEQILKKM